MPHAAWVAEGLNPAVGHTQVGPFRYSFRLVGKD